MFSETAEGSAQPLKNGWVPVFWEPVSGTGECLMVGAIVHFDGKISAHRIIRDDALHALYGKSIGTPANLISYGLNDLKIIAEHRGLAALENEKSTGLSCRRPRYTEPESVDDALRTAATMFSSLANIDLVDELESDDSPNQEEQVKHWSIDVRERVLSVRPDFMKSFNQSVRFYPDGEPVRFGFINDRAVIHFGVLRPVQQSSSLRDARARLWELARAQEAAPRPSAALLLAVPRPQDPVLGEKQLAAAQRNQREIEREADEVGIRLKPVTSAIEGAKKLLEMAQ